MSLNDLIIITNNQLYLYNKYKLVKTKNKIHTKK